jgi:hypothetical protein
MINRLVRSMIRPSVYTFASEVQPVKQQAKTARPSSIT